MKTLFKHILDNIAYLTATTFFISKSQLPSKLLIKKSFNDKEKFLLTLVFSLISIAGTYIGIDYKGAIANTRNIGVVVGGLLGGPIVGLSVGFLAGLHRILIDINGITAFSCGLATFIGGGLAGYFHKFIKPSNQKLWGFILGIIVENISMLFILLMARPYHLALDIVTNIYVPMVLLNALGIYIIIFLVEDIVKEQEKEAGKQIKLAMDIATQTLPYFRIFNKESLEKVCKIIQKDLNAQLVVITDRNNILASAAQSKIFEINHIKIRSDYTKKVIESGDVLASMKNSDNKDLSYNNPKIKSSIIAPLKINNNVEGTLKIYFDKVNSITERNKYLIDGLSQLISNQMEISQVSILKEMADKAEIKALQAQINPHFLFNTLNAINSFIRINPDKSRELIQDLSTYLRYNIDYGAERVTLAEELKQCKAYSNIELARFKGTLEVEYSIPQENLDIQLPHLTLQPLVENAIKHGALNTQENIGRVKVEVHKIDSSYEISVWDNGPGFTKKSIDELYSDQKVNNRIGLYNVHRRLLLISGQGLSIDIDKGTRVSFKVEEKKEKR